MAFVVSAGQVRAVSSAPSRPYGYGGPIPAYIELSPTVHMTYSALWRAQPAVRTVIGFLARNVASLGLDAYERVSATDRVKLREHPLARLLEQPLPGSAWTKYRLLNTLMHDLCLFDEAFWLKLRANNGVGAIVPVPHRLITPIGTNWLAPEKYRITGNYGYKDVAVDSVVHFHGYSPDDTYSGVSPIETLRQILAEEYAASAYREQMWRNGARTSGFIERPADAPTWSQGAKDRFRSDFRFAFAGDGPDAGGTPLLEDGMHFNGSGVTPKDAQYVEARKLTREEVAVAYFVSPVMLGLMDGVTIGNVTELHKMLYQDTLPPWLIQISQDIECQLLPDLDASGKVYVEFNLNDKLRGSFEQQAAAISSSVGGPWMLRSEARAMYNLPEVDGADELVVPLNVVAGGLSSPRDTAPDEPDNGPSNGQPPKAAALIRACRKRQERVVLGRLGKADTVPAIGDVFDLDRWNAELAQDLAIANVDGGDLIALAANNQAWMALRGALCAGDPLTAARDVFAAYAQEEHPC